MARSKLALHWKILIGLVLGVVVGLAVNAAWTGAVWGGLGVGDPTAFVKGRAPELRKGLPADSSDASAALRAVVDGVLAGSDDEPRQFQPDANPYTRASVARLVAAFRVEDGAGAVTPTRDDYWVSLEWLRAALDEFDRTGAVQRTPIEPPEDQVLAGALRWTLAEVVLSSEAIGALNNDAGLGAKAAVFVRHATEFVGDVFMRGLKFIAVPIVLFSLVAGVASLNDTAKLGRIGGRTILIYLVTTALAITIGLVLANTISPGSGFPEDVRTELADKGKVTATGKISDAEEQRERSTWQVLLDIVPTNPFGAMAEGNTLQVVVAALLVGVALTLLPHERAGPVIALFETMTDVIIKIVHMVLAVAPYAVFALIVVVVADLGFAVLASLAKYALTVVLGLGVMIFAVYPLALRAFTPVGYGRFFGAIAPAQLLAFSSSSSGATLPVTMDCLENRLGVKEQITSFVAPIGATINMDGTALYQGVAAVFIAQAFGVDLTIGDQLTIVLTATLASIGTAAVPGVGIVMLIIVLQAVRMPPEAMTTGIAVILGVDRILDMCRTACNVTGDCMVSAVVGHAEGELETAEQVRARAEAESARGLDEYTKEEEEREKAAG